VTNPTTYRLALRVEGDWWNAYCAPTHTMAGAVWLGSILMSEAQHPPVKQAFMLLMELAMTTWLQRTQGVRVDWSETDPEPAPEHERSGRA
jgi:hypothetical protein